MSNQFNTYQLGDVAKIIAGGDKPKVFSVDKASSVHVPVFANAEKKNGLLGYTDNARIFEPAVTVAARGSNVGFVAVRKEPFFPVVRLLSLVPKKECLDVDYLFYNLKQNRKTGTGSGQPQITIPDISSKTISLPPISVQKKVAEVLSILDKKIELNNRINVELETLAKTLYGYWFVQFDFPDDSPQGQGKPYKTSGGKMVYNPTLNREIPEGWNECILGEYVTFKRGISYKSGDIQDKGVPFLNLNSFSLSGKFKQIGTKYYNGKFKPESKLDAGELAIAITDVTRNADIIGKAFVIPDIFDEKPLISCDVACVSSKYFGEAYLEQLFNSNSYHKYIKHFASGTLVLHLDLNGVKWFKTYLPPQNILDKYNQQCNSLFKQRDIVLKENVYLESLRNWLLPMLMNGQVTVK
jgi:type I restriction enzyme S subunit